MTNPGQGGLRRKSAHGLRIQVIFSSFFIYLLDQSTEASERAVPSPADQASTRRVNAVT